MLPHLIFIRRTANDHRISQKYPDILAADRRYTWKFRRETERENREFPN